MLERRDSPLRSVLPPRTRTRVLRPRGPPTAAPGLLFYILVDSVAATVDKVIANGGEIVQPIGANAPELTARFRDPGGNVVGLYQHPA
ncbi:MAG TPA: VOC family protein [Candidatus Acidoferrales bacterium]|nr:VOC family protein [Candidatus Acidoferrales bacterium]